ncbi:Aste57867_1651 [Aphanomyces stellatus]|uniref:Aste57867_1651 protein n=1 Tax=Aphanomyces stellatus TaxID=120398 RepID=A0A485K671_9STRA|nr:hypothetical protein As57867_001649 [Aphanomyces stellatus]VFT78864.1 Aste57867_1651 [Aphanomyces stellatus]
MGGPTAILSTAQSLPTNASIHAPTRPAPIPSTVILLDWDDTLFPNAYLAKKAYSIDEPHVNPIGCGDLILLDFLAKHIATFLHACADANRAVMIITNGEAGWVERSCKRFLPQILPLIESIRIVSARTLYEASCPIHEWKVAAFTSEMTKHFQSDFSGNTRHIVSIGDSHYERQAVQVLPRSIPLTKTKSVKFVEQPTVLDMVRQLKLVSTYLSHLCSHPEHLDLILSREVIRDVVV